MSLLRSAQRCNQLLQSSHHINGVRLSERSINRHLSTAGPEQPSQEQSSQPDQEQSSPIAPFLQAPSSSGYVYGRVFGINRHTLKSDIINLLEGSNLSPDNVKVAYSRLFNPKSMLVQFSSITDYAAAVRAVARKGRVYRLEKTHEKEWDNTKPYNARYVLMEGLSLNTSPDDVHRFLDGFSYDSSSFEMFLRASSRDPIKMASVRFPSQIEAFNASIRKNREFLNNNQVIVRVLQ